MATKAQLNDDGTVSDSVTKENQKGYANYEADNTKKQREMETKDAKFKETIKQGVEKVRGVMGFAKGGSISKTDMKKAGFYDKGKTKSERQKIVNEVTTKPQRVAIVEKAFSTKNMKSGGMASKRADGIAKRGKTKGKMC